VPVLPYCIILAGAEVEPPATGVRESAVEDLVEDGVRCFYSVVSDFSLSSAPELKSDALRFDAVVRQLLANTAVIPFRFPTLLVSAGELRDFASAHAAQYAATLNRLKDLVQMELRIEHASLVSALVGSGTAYLQSRARATRALSEAADYVRTTASDLIRDWRTRKVARGLRCYALVPRDRVAEYQARMRSLSTPDGVTIVVSGPWPASEFFHDTTQS
jgi:hypothetical protein